MHERPLIDVPEVIDGREKLATVIDLDLVRPRDTASTEGERARCGDRCREGRRVQASLHARSEGALRRLIAENQKQNGYVCAVSERVFFSARVDRRRAVILDLSKTDLVEAEAFSKPNHQPNGRAEVS